MLIAHYTHRLPAGFDLGLIRSRAKERGPLWDATPDLVFKAFLLRDRGRNGASANSYSSLYLWRREEAFAAFLRDGRFRVVTDSFGRPPIETRSVLDARLGPARTPRFAHRSDEAIGGDEDLQERLAEAVARNTEAGMRPEVVAAVVGVSPLDWVITRLLISDRPIESGRPGATHEVLHLAGPLLATLPRSEQQSRPGA